MKQFYLLFTFLLTTNFLTAQDAPFITTWEVTADDLEIIIPTDGDGYNYSVDFGDGTVLNNQTDNVFHTYDSAGIYTVTINGDFPRIRFNIGLAFSAQHKLLTIEQWGDIQWQIMNDAFYRCENLTINATDIPDLSQVTDMSNMFNQCESLNSNLNNWDVSNVVNMKGLFFGAYSFNQPLNDWDVSNVTDMESMFQAAYSFNQPLNDWDVSNVIDMYNMFAGSFTEYNAFNQPLDNWDVSSVTDMGGMFNSSEFNKSLNNWNVSGVIKMDRMFKNTTSFNQPLNSWDVSDVTLMYSMFELAENFNQSLNNWDVSNVNQMQAVFSQASSFNQSLSNWNIQTTNLSNFLSGSGMNFSNYDSLLANLLSKGLTSGGLGADGLEYCNEAAHDQLIENLNWSINGDTLGENCIYYNLLFGSVRYDENNNGCDEADSVYNGTFIINIFNEENNIGIIPNAEGNYSYYLNNGSYEVSLNNTIDYYSVNPETTTINFDATFYEEQVDFCITANQTIEDLNITLLPISEARPGFEADYQLVIENMGTQTVAAASISLTFDENAQSFIMSTPAETSSTTNELTFEVNDLPPFGQQVIDFTMQTFQPPTVNGDDVLNFTAEVTPNTNDYTPEDNTFNYEQIVVNSYDPNDKQVLQGAQVPIDDADQYLDYLIRFQNTGTASAINVRVVDTLHPNLDYSTIRPINASDNYRVEITNGNHVEFIFDDINLPHEAADEEGSNGFIAYKIKPKENSLVGDVITGDAQIFFDFNAPIITNMVATEFVDNLGVNTVNSVKSQIVIYPNPTNNLLNLQPNRGVVLEEVTIYNLQGRKLLNFNKNLEQLNLENLSAGMYILNIQTSEGVINKQLVKK